MKKLFLAGFLAFFLCGCGNLTYTRVEQGVVVVNNTKEYSLLVFVDGVQRSQALTPGEHYAVSLENYDNVYRQTSLLVKAYDKNGSFTGAAERNFQASPFPYYQGMVAWLVTRFEIQSTGSGY